MKFYNKSSQHVLQELNVNQHTGLTEKDVEERRKKYGLNEFTVKEEGGIFKDILEALSEPMIVILIIAALVSMLIGEFSDAIGIIGAIIIGVGIGLITEGKSKKAAEELSKLTENIDVKVIRDGKVQQIQKIIL